MSAHLLGIVAQAAPTPTDSNTGVIVAVIGAVALVLAAVITASGTRTGKRIDRVEARVEGVGRDLGGRIDSVATRLESSVERFEGAVDRLTERVDRLYGGAQTEAPSRSMTSTRLSARDTRPTVAKKPTASSGLSKVAKPARKSAAARNPGSGRVVEKPDR